MPGIGPWFHFRLARYRGFLFWEFDTSRWASLFVQSKIGTCKQHWGLFRAFLLWYFLFISSVSSEDCVGPSLFVSFLEFGIQLVWSRFVTSVSLMPDVFSFIQYSASPELVLLLGKVAKHQSDLSVNNHKSGRYIGSFVIWGIDIPWVQCRFVSHTVCWWLLYSFKSPSHVVWCSYFF